MPRRRKPPRLYLDPARRVWVLRYGKRFKRTGYREDQRAEAEAVLDGITKSKDWAARFHVPGTARSPTTKKLQPKRNGIEGIVYFVSAAGDDAAPVKIGFCCANPQKRLSELQIGNHRQLELLATHPATYSQERAIHWRLSGDRVLGEWFARSPGTDAALTAAQNGTLHAWINDLTLAA
jgi:hypothetical protein